LLATIPTLFGVLVVAFLLLNVVPGDPVAEMVGERADSATIVRLRAAGTHFRNEVERGPGGSQILIDDPDGNPIELFEARQ